MRNLCGFVESGADCVDLESANPKNFPTASSSLSPGTCPPATIVSPSIVTSIVAAQGEGPCGHQNATLLSWYWKWLNRRLEQLPPSILECVVSFQSMSTEVARLAKTHCSLEDMVLSLISKGLVVADDPDRAKHVALTLTFGLLGWQTMLYEADLATPSFGQIAISDVLDGYRSTTFFKLRQDTPDLKRKLPEVLLGFGLMLRKENSRTSEETEDTEAFENIGTVTPSGLNAATMKMLAHLKIQWVDVMGPHLELDKATNTVFLFRYPSFCLANMPTQEDIASKGVIHGLANEGDSLDEWASETETTQFLKEILLSYRLLFAQDKASRRLFRRMNVFGKQPVAYHDPFLSQICAAKRPPIEGLLPDHESYTLNRHFPVLRERIAILQQQLQTLKPRTWKEIWKDRRDSVQWWTFWAVIFFGGAGTLLSLVQTILQGVQTFTN